MEIRMYIHGSTATSVDPVEIDSSSPSTQAIVRHEEEKPPASPTADIANEESAQDPEMKSSAIHRSCPSATGGCAGNLGLRADDLASNHHPHARQSQLVLAYEKTQQLANHTRATNTTFVVEAYSSESLYRRLRMMLGMVGRVQSVHASLKCIAESDPEPCIVNEHGFAIDGPATDLPLKMGYPLLHQLVSLFGVDSPVSPSVIRIPMIHEPKDNAHRDVRVKVDFCLAGGVKASVALYQTDNGTASETFRVVGEKGVLELNITAISRAGTISFTSHENRDVLQVEIQAGAGSEQCDLGSAGDVRDESEEKSDSTSDTGCGDDWQKRRRVHFQAMQLVEAIRTRIREIRQIFLVPQNLTAKDLGEVCAAS
ncbi:hypothetical protein CC1G_09068 [Coprinopsis cinerea okayama7|uniref:Uncharacterized protein n=1 Tax=Coprinopsis cinerea (strain Okayama-7 / 130 / ATCC MYA-4618 / FGSC 9003) TaxID=240176 RepID=A8P306_COPC7|nr:hypothetical protein CC1G_09068 [Coprinopsis cinerea okayama7\|eukprot:XP_001838440.1 hypothetical protein CC1G_09068 [Coprinopsis cinerea okayama7\